MAKQTYPKSNKNSKTVQQLAQENKLDHERRLRDAMRELRKVIKAKKENTSSA
jgi:hypothetical protein